MALSLAVLLSLFLAILEGVRSNTVFLEAELIADIGLDSVLAEYHRELLEQYNLFFIDTSYGTAQPSVETVSRHLENYVEQNCKTEEVLLGEWFYRDFLSLEADNVRISRVATAVDAKGHIFRKRAADAIRDDIGMTYLQKMMDWLNTVENYSLNERDLEQEKKLLDQEISSYDGSERLAGDDWVSVEVEDPTRPLEMQKSRGILQLVLDTEKMSALSGIGVKQNNLISARYAQGLVNQGNWNLEEQESLWDRLLFYEYVSRYCGCYAQPKEEGLLRYQIEYVIAGKNNDLDNLKSVVNRLTALRGAANALYLFADQSKCAQADAAAWAASGLMLLPEIQPLIKGAILLGWAYAESLYDVRCLLAGEKVPLLKTKETWHYDISCVLEGLLDLDGGASTETEDGGQGLNYGEYLRILLALTPIQEETFRVMDVVEMDIRQTSGNQFFRMDGCIDRLEAVIGIRSTYGYSANLTRRKAY